MSAWADNAVNRNQSDFSALIHDPGEPGTSGSSGNSFNFCKK
jgi:hypothetical protein